MATFHDSGIARRNILGFDGRNGWVPNNQVFDKQCTNMVLTFEEACILQQQTHSLVALFLVDYEELVGTDGRDVVEGTT